MLSSKSGALAHGPSAVRTIRPLPCAARTTDQPRADLDKPGFKLVIEAGLGAGPGGFRNFSVHTFPSSRRLDEIWPRSTQESTIDVSSMPAYKALRNSGIDACGLAQLASRTVGVPFVGLIAGALAVAEPLRRLHGAEGFELVSGSVLNLEDIVQARVPFAPYAFGHAGVCARSRYFTPRRRDRKAISKTPRLEKGRKKDFYSSH
jgi:hypothetical protein